MLRLSRTHCESRPRRRPESMRNRAVLSAILADRRRALGLSQKDLAGSEVSASYVSLLEAGKRWPTEEVLTALARRLGTTATALLAGQDGPARTAEQRRLDLQWGQLALQSGQAASAEARAQGLLEDVLATTDEHLEAKALLAAAVELQGRPHEAIGILEPLVEELQQSSWQSLWISTHLALCRCYRDVGDYAHAIDLGERAMRASKHLPAEETALLAVTLGGVYIQRGDLTRAGRILSNVLHQAEAGGSHRSRGAALWNASLVAADEGRMADAAQMAERALAIFGESEQTRNLGKLRLTYAWFLLESSPPEPDRATELLHGALVELRVTGSTVEQANCLIELVRCALIEGDLAAASELIDEAADTLGDAPEAERARVALVRAQVLTASGQAEEGLHLARTSITVLEQVASDSELARAWKELAMMARAAGDDSARTEALENALAAMGLRPDAVDHAISTLWSTTPSLEGRR